LAIWHFWQLSIGRYPSSSVVKFFMADLESLAGDPRVTIRRKGAPDPEGACVVYWMQRSQRALDNPALETAVKAANLLGKPCVVFFAPMPFYPHANGRHYHFLNQGIQAIAAGLRKRGIGFVLRRYPGHHLLKFCEEVRPALVVGDENPLRETEKWRQTVARKLRLPFWTVDSDVIIPSKLLMKEQYGAYTARPVIRRLLPQFLQPVGNTRAKVEWRAPRSLQSLAPDVEITAGWELDRSVAPVDTFIGGTDEALKRLKQFTAAGLAVYPGHRNKPELDATSHLSAYLHFGHIGPHTVALAVGQSGAPAEAREAYLEQLIVRRELAVNFVRFNPDYDNFESGAAWAHQSLAEHAGDPRKLYSESQMENAMTHDPLWNASQKQMTMTGFMHNYMRMYWAKKILEWSKTPARAYQTAVYLNDKYELDGRDPNGYAGIAWAIVGKHDRPWFERPVFGKIRYMSFNSTSKKFDSQRYIARMEALAQNNAAKQSSGRKQLPPEQGRLEGF
jgi:deoxyribodipyrimidine photo-lyase